MSQDPELACSQCHAAASWNKTDAFVAFTKTGKAVTLIERQAECASCGAYLGVIALFVDGGTPESVGLEPRKRAGAPEKTV